MLNLKKNVVFSVAELITNILLLFITYRLIVRFGGSALLGLWSTLFAWLSLVRIGDIGIGGAVTRYVAGLDINADRERITELIDTALVSNSVLYSVLLLVVGFIGHRYVTWMVGTEYAPRALLVFPWMLTSLLLSNVSAVILSSLVALHISYQRSIITVLGNILQLILVIVLLPSLGLVGFAISQVIQYFVSAIIGWMLVCRKIGYYRLPFKASISSLRKILGFSLMLQAATLSNGIFEPLSKLLVSHFGGLATQGLYEAAYKTVFLVRNVATQASTVTIPALTKLVRSDPGAASTLYKKVKWRVIACVAIGAVCLLPGSWIISYFWFGELNHRYLIFVTVLLVGMFANGASASAYNIGLATGYLRGNVIAAISSLAILALFGSMAGYFNKPVLIVFTVTVSFILSSVLVVVMNESSFYQRIRRGMLN